MQKRSGNRKGDGASRPRNNFEPGGKRPGKNNDRPFGKRPGGPLGERSEGDRPKERPSRDFPERAGNRSFERDERKGDGKKEGRFLSNDREKRYGPKKEGNFRGKRDADKRFERKDGERPTSIDRDDRRPAERPFTKKGAMNREDNKAPGKKRFEDSRPFRDRNKSESKPFEKKRASKAEGQSEQAPEHKFDKVLSNVFNQPKGEKNDDEFSKPAVHEDKVFGELPDPKSGLEGKYLYGTSKKTRKPGKKKFDEDEQEAAPAESAEEQMPLNKYIAHSGECSRRDAAELVKQGKVKVNGELVLDPGYKVKYADNVTLVGKKLKPQKDRVYLLLNKPKGYITTNEDPQGRKTVMDLVQGAGVERLFPVGRLDRDTSGLLLITNDGELTQKLCHPSFDIKKVYQVTLDKPVTKADFEKIIEGVELEDGKAPVDALAYLESKNELGLEIHSGKNRIVRRIFESLGYVVEKLDRVMYAGLTKKNLPRGKWRHLEPREVILLKHFKS